MSHSHSADEQDLCWNCKSETQFKHFCGTCVKIQPADQKMDFFSFMELPRKLVVDEKDLQKKFYELSRKFHPDFFQNSESKEKALALEKSSILNRAYETLRDPFERAEYLLDLEKYTTNTEINQASPELLAEMFEIQENIESLTQKEGRSLDAGRESKEVVSARALVNDRMRETRENLDKIFHEWDSLNDAERKKMLVLEIRKLIHQKKYLETANRTINTAAELWRQ